MTDDISSQRRGLAAAFAVCALASLTLLANHPNESRGSFSDLINNEAAHRVIDGVVHGGFIVTLTALISCFVILSRFLGLARPPVVVGLVCFCTGCAALMASMILDGLAVPALAARFIHAEDLQPAKTLFIFIGTLIGILMPIGMSFQSVAMISWSWVIAGERGLGRAVGAYGLAVALVLIAAIFAIPATMASHVILGGIVLQSIWYLAIAVLLVRS
jgi:hypothetical protein